MINSEEKNRLSWLEVIKSINWQAILLCVIGFFIGRVCLFNTFYTLGIAYVGAMFFDKQTRRWSALLTTIGILSVGILNHNMLLEINLIRYILMIALLCTFRGVMVALRVEFNLRNQLVLLAISMFIINGMNLMINQFTIYRLVVSLLETVVGLGLMRVLSIAIIHIYERKNSVLIEYELVSMAFFIACILFGMIDVNMVVPLAGKIYLKDILIFIILIGATYLGGINGATVMSIMISTVLVVLGYMPASFVAIYVFAALIGGVFSHLDRVGIIFSTTLGLLLGFALFNDKVIDGSIMGAYIVAAGISLCIPRGYFGIANWFDYATELDEVHHLANIQSIITARLKNFSKAFENLGKQFEKLPLNNIELDLAEMNSIIEETGEAMCRECSMRNFCWDDYLKATYQSGYGMLQVLEHKGQIVDGDIPPSFRKSCINAESFAYTLGIKFDVFRQECKWRKNFQEARGLIAEEFKGIAESVKKLSNSVEGNFTFNKEDERLVKEALQGVGIRSKDIMVLESGGRKCEIHIYCGYRGEADYKEKVLEAAQKALDADLEIKKYEYYEEEKVCYFVLGVKKQFSVMVSARNQAMDRVCGDTYSFMELEGGKYLVALADGMGSGVQAAEESKAAIELLENFLEAGFESEVALKIINSAMVLRAEVESYATMDMALIDQYTGVVEFLKMGASTSFILRGDEVLTVKASSLPIGILSHIDLVSFKKQLKEGDILIMVTDGVLEDKNDLSDRENTFKHFILESKSNSPEYMVNFLLDKTKNLLAGEPSDDMTIAVARIWK